MTTLALIVALRGQGGQLEAREGTLYVRSPKGTPVPPALKQEVRAHKDEILRRLQSGGVSLEEVNEVFPGVEVTGTEAVSEAPWGWCPHCAGQRWWVSRFGLRSCVTCLPPADKGMVLVWLPDPREQAAT